MSVLGHECPRAGGRLMSEQCLQSGRSPYGWHLAIRVLFVACRKRIYSSFVSVCHVRSPFETERAMTPVSPVPEAFKELASTFGGQLLQPADSGYEEARRVHNGLVDKRPALIARCAGMADIADAVNV